MSPEYTLKALLDGDRADLDGAITGWVILPVANEIIYLNTVCVSIWVIYILFGNDFSVFPSSRQQKVACSVFCYCLILAKMPGNNPRG